MKRIKFLALMTITIALYVPSLAFSDETPIATGTKFVCVDESTVTKVKGQERRALNKKQVRKAVRSLKKKIRTLTKKATRAEAAGDDDKANTLRNRIDISLETIAGIKACKKGELINACKVVGHSKEEERGSDISSHIVDGEVCQRGDSFVVEVKVKNGAADIGRCTGSILTPNLVITAAHCFYDSNGQPSATSVQVTTSYDDYTTDIWDHGTYIFEGNVNFLSDYALILLENPIDQARPVKIVDPLEGAFVGEKIVVAGYGKDRDGFEGPLTAGTMTVDEVSGGRIYSNFNDLPLESNTCGGDSGGPLLVKRDGEWFLAGLTRGGTLASCLAGDRSDFIDITNADIQAVLSDYLLYKGNPS